VSRLFDPASVAQIKHARKSFFDSGQTPAELLDEVITRSWQRCAVSGLNHSDRSRQPNRLTDAALHHEKDRNSTLVLHARPVMEYLYEHICNSQSMVLLSDPRGMILHALGDPDFAAKADRVALQPGVLWSEEEKGTNAIGTAISEQVAILVHGPEHFLDRNAFLTCTAAPIVGANGRMIGVLDVSGDHRNYQRHTMALVRMLAQLIENRLLATEFANEMVIHFHTQPEGLGTLGEGIAVFTFDGRFVAANEAALLRLRIARTELPLRNYETVFETPFDELFGHVQRGSHPPLSLCLRGGARLFAKVKTRTLGAPPTFIPLGATFNPSARAALRSNSASSAKVTLESLDTGDSRMRHALEKARKILGRDIPVLIEGESGVGKELFAEALHNGGPRRDGPFVAVNCAAIPEGLIESELFGYQEGAFTGARRKGALGKILQADRGTLFLDEIGDMPLALQSRLLRVLQERSVTPLGGAKAYAVDISLVCATHHNLKDDIANGRFREDLYYRLNGLRFTLPPLRSRTDLDELVNRILRDTEADDARRVAVSDEVSEIFRQHPWPGNIRQLKNVIRAARALLGTEDTILPYHLPEDFLEELAGVDTVEKTRARAQEAASDARMTGNLEEIEIAAIRQALDENRGNVSAAARQLGICRNTLYRKLGRQ
jgi:sigma-54 dependent transcriptional regulator, acetoin dehydrogenase operon transcriptional activator AcoR